jgi:hypothetical protein
MKQQYRNSRLDPVSALVLGTTVNKYPPILRRDEDGDIARRFSDEDMVNEGLRYDRVVLDHINNPHYKTKQERRQLKDFKANHTDYGKRLNSDKEKTSIVNHMKQLMENPKYKVRMNATYNLVGYSK